MTTLYGFSFLTLSIWKKLAMKADNIYFVSEKEFNNSSTSIFLDPVKEKHAFDYLSSIERPGASYFKVCANDSSSDDVTYCLFLGGDNKTLYLERSDTRNRYVISFRRKSEESKDVYIKCYYDRLAWKHFINSIKISPA